MIATSTLHYNINHQGHDEAAKKGTNVDLIEVIKMSPDEIQNLLPQFIGTENYFCHSPPNNYFTDGVKFVADECKAYWLLDLIFSAQTLKRVRREEFQMWLLKVTGSTAKAICDDGNGNILFSQEIPFTDFPLPVIKLYLENHVLMLPSER